MFSPLEMIDAAENYRNSASKSWDNSNYETMSRQTAFGSLCANIATAKLLVQIEQHLELLASPIREQRKAERDKRRKEIVENNTVIKEVYNAYIKNKLGTVSLVYWTIRDAVLDALEDYPYSKPYYSFLETIELFKKELGKVNGGRIAEIRNIGPVSILMLRKAFDVPDPAEREPKLTTAKKKLREKAKQDAEDSSS